MDNTLMDNNQKRIEDLLNVDGQINMTNLIRVMSNLPDITKRLKERFEKDKTDLDLVSMLSPMERLVLEVSMFSISPDDGKYLENTSRFFNYLSGREEWAACAYVQKILLETRMEYGQAKQKHMDELNYALTKISPLNISLLEKLVTKHDQLAVLEEIGRFVSEETKALLHPGTTSFDILDTARPYLYQKSWNEVLRPKVIECIEKISNLSERSHPILGVGRTHLQRTSPVPYGTTFALYAARLAERMDKCDLFFQGLKGKISGIVGTGASIDMVIGEGKSIQFEKDVLKKLGLEPDYTATQITQKEALSDVGHGITTLMGVLGDFANDIRMLYSSEINEVTSRDNAKRLGGSSADATKNNPIDYENICGKLKIIESGMAIVYDMIHSDFQRDLRNSVQARYQPNAMIVQTYESFSRLNKSLDQLSFNEDSIAKNLQPIRNNPSEALVAILRGEGWVHSKYGVGHNYVKKIGIEAKKQNIRLLDVAMKDNEFNKLYDSLTINKRRILGGELELYTGSALKRAQINLDYARKIISN